MEFLTSFTLLECVALHFDDRVIKQSSVEWHINCDQAPDITVHSVLLSSGLDQSTFQGGRQIHFRLYSSKTVIESRNFGSANRTPNDVLVHSQERSD